MAVLPRRRRRYSYYILTTDTRAGVPLPRGAVSPVAAAGGAVAARRSGSPWHRLSIGAQILITCAAINLAAAAGATAVVIVNARAATRVEMAASLEIAERTVRETAARLDGRVGADGLAAALDLGPGPLRHVRLTIFDPAGVPIAAAEEGPADTEAPAWFARLVAPAAEQVAVAVTLAGGDIATIAVTGEPSDEIDEVWEDFRALAAIGLLLNVLVVVVLAVALRRLLRPLSDLADGLRRLERGDLGARLPRPRGLELAALADRFNALAGNLAAAREENAGLNRRLISAQDDERRGLANEISEAAAPEIAALRGHAGAILGLAGEIGARRGEEVCDRAGAMLDRLDAIQALHRRLLERLRPATLGPGPLGRLIAELVDDARRREPRIRFSLAVDGLAERYGEPVDQTVWSALADLLDEVASQSRPTAIAVSVTEDRPARRLRLRVVDNGFAPVDARDLAPVAERVRALGGTLAAGGSATAGGRVDVEIPLDVPREAGRA